MIRGLAKLLDETGLTDIEIERDGYRVKIGRAARAVQVSAPPAMPLATALAPAPTNDPAKHPGAVPSPMVGTAYLAPSPGARPFVDIGQAVKAGDTLLYYYGFMFTIIVNSIIWWAISFVASKLIWKNTGLNDQKYLIQYFLLKSKLKQRKSV